MPCVTPLRLAVALDGLGWHPAAARVAGIEPDAQYWEALAQEAEQGRLDFITFEREPVTRAAQVAAVTTRIGLIPAVGATPEIANLDALTKGRAGCLVPQTIVDDGSEPSRGPSPIVAVRSARGSGPATAARSADLVFVNPLDDDQTREVVDAVRSDRAAHGRADRPLRIFADVAVLIDGTQEEALARRAHLDDLADGEAGAEMAVFTGTATGLQRRLQAWLRLGLDGFRLHPAVLPHDLYGITRGLVPTLQENDAFRRSYETRTLTALLGIHRQSTPA